MNWNVLAVVALVTLAAGTPAEDKAGDARKELAGVWATVSMVVDGEEIPADRCEGVRLEVDPAGKYALRDIYRSPDGKPYERGRLVLDAASSPKAIDLLAAQGPDRDLSSLGIYKLEGDRLTLCYAQAGVKTRPTKFASKAGKDGVVLHVLRRVKP